MTAEAEKRLDYPAGFAMFEAESRGAGNAPTLLTTPPDEEAHMANDTATAVGGDSSTLAPKMGRNDPEINNNWQHISSPIARVVANVLRRMEERDDA